MSKEMFIPEKDVAGKSALEVLAEMPSVTGNELTELLDVFQDSLEAVVQDPNKQMEMYAGLQEINPSFSPKQYAEDSKANSLANIVAAYYAPLIHGFSGMVLKNIEDGWLPDTIFAPPRDTIPIANSLSCLSQIKGVPVKVLQPSITRKTAGVYNNQNGEFTGQDPLFSQMVKDVGGDISEVVEIEFGIYSTTSLSTAKIMAENGLKQFVPLKFYGLGPNLSWVHALLANGQEWIAEKAEAEGLVSGQEIASLMVLIDSFEEFGMQNMHQTVGELSLDNNGQVVPVIEPVNNEVLEIARATNLAVIETAALYADIQSEQVVALLNWMPKMKLMAQQGFPTMLTKPIPPMNNYDDHFQQIKDSGLFSHPELLL